MCWGDGGDGDGGGNGDGNDGLPEGVDAGDLADQGPSSPGSGPGSITGANAGDALGGPSGPDAPFAPGDPNIDEDDLPGNIPTGSPIDRTDEETLGGPYGRMSPSEWNTPITFVQGPQPGTRESSDPKDDDFVGPPDPRTGGGFEPRSKEGMDVREEYWDETRNWPGIPGALPWAYYTDPTNLTDLRDALIDLATPMAFKVGQALVGNLGNIEVSHTAPEDSPDFVESDGGERERPRVIEEAVDNQRRAAATSANRFAPGSTVPYARFREGWRDDEALGTSLGDGRFGTRRTVLTGQ